MAVTDTAIHEIDVLQWFTVGVGLGEVPANNNTSATPARAWSTPGEMVMRTQVG